MIITVFTISIFLMIVLPVVLGIIWRFHFHAPWLLFCAGMLTFIAAQIVHIPLNLGLTRLGLLPENGLSTALPVWRTALILGLTAGICEALARTAGFAILKRYRGGEHGVLLGLGHGGIESMIFGGVLTAATLTSLWGLQGNDLRSLNLSPDQHLLLTRQLESIQNAWSAILPLLERLLALLAQVVFSMLVLTAFRRHKWFFVLLAVLYHALLDGVIVYMSTIWQNPWAIEGLFAVLLLPGLVWLRTVLPRRQAVVGVEANFILEIKTLWLAYKKELLYQWRSKRMLVVLAVFVAFGLTSPLLAYFTPQIVGSFKGAEMFANLIPTPTVADALAQYIKNITQFGFILAIFLGMSAVVGEKEKGTAAMILSKPMPRWVYLLSKWLAQVSVYVLAFVVGSLGAYYYSVLLFGGLDFGQFMLGNLLLLLWLLTFVSVSLLGSVLGKSTAAAAGIGLFLSVILLTSAYLPKVGIFAPGGLVGWAATLGTGVAMAANGGALAMSAVLVMISLLTALAVFEVQEI